MARGMADLDDPSSDEYDPEQPMAERRAIQRGIRDLISKTNENKDDFLESNPEIFNSVLEESAQLMGRAKQTTEAAIDARLILQVSELAYKRSLKWTSGNVGNGIDVDEFVSKCVTYMRQGRGIGDDDAPELSSTQRQRRVVGNRGAIGDDDDEDEVGDEGDMLNWEHLGRFACIPHVRRPALPGFLLGPLSIEKKVRKITKKTARLRINNIKETRPEILRAEDLAQKEKTDLPALCTKILRRLETVQNQAQQRVEAECDDMDEDETKQLFNKIGLRGDGGVDLFRFVINPHSFGQTVENMFYVSFLIRDGKVGIEYDEDELPSLYPVPQEDHQSATARRGAMKHQAVMSIDMDMWQEVIKAFNIREPMIETRREEIHNGPGSRGWYN